MREKIKIKHKLKNGEYCSEMLEKEPWGGDDFKLSCFKCGFFRIIDNSLFLKWQYCDEVTDDNST